MAKKKLWYMKFDVGAWLSDEKLRACSIAARGLWIEMLSLMFKNDRRGYLQVGGKPPSQEQLARMTGCSTEEASRLLAELLTADVASVLADGTIYSRRMIRQTQLSETRATSGRTGGEKTASRLLKQKDKQTVEQAGQQEAKQASISDSSCLEGDLSPREKTDTQGRGGPGERELAQAKSQQTRCKGLAVDALDRDFDAFWGAYPNRNAKHEARKAWDEISPSAETIARILEAIVVQKGWREWQNGFVPLAANWLRGRRWEDKGTDVPSAALESHEQRLARLRGDNG